jgi:hypothetical protein
MATLFTSYQHQDEGLARQIELRLKAHGHSFKIPAGSRVAGDWRSKFLNALAQSDAVVFLLSERGLSSPHVLGQIGSARVYAGLNGQLMLPVVIGNIEIPDIVSDIQCFEISGQDATELDSLADGLSQAVQNHDPGTSEAPRIFVSHRHKEEPIAAALVALLEAAFQIDAKDIRCTSVQPYALPPGERVSERLRRDLNGAELVIGLIGPDTAESSYTLFELGASWGREVATFPLLVRGADANSVPGPLGERLSVSLSTEDNCMQLIDNIAAKTRLKRKEFVAGRVAQQAKKLALLAGQVEELTPKNASASASTRSTLSQAEADRMAKHITNYLQARNFTHASFDRIREKVNPTYSDAALFELIDISPDKFRRSNAKGKMGIALLGR